MIQNPIQNFHWKSVNLNSSGFNVQFAPQGDASTMSPPPPPDQGSDKEEDTECVCVCEMDGHPIHLAPPDRH